MNAAVRAYHALLDRSAVESAELLREGQREQRLFFGERPLCVSLRPRLIPLGEYEAAVAATESIYSALEALERALLRDATLRRELDLGAEEERLALADAGCRSSSPSSRLDGFFSGRLRYVEYNAESPAGMAYADNLSGVFDALPVMRAFRRRYRLRRVPVRARQLATMLRAFRQWGRERTPVIAIVDWRGLPTETEWQMFRDYFEARGVRALIADPRALEFRRGRLYADGTRVNLVYRRVLTSELLAKGDETKALRDAYLAGAVCVVNTFRAKLLHKKMSLALLSDDRYAALYTPAQRRAVARHVPWTRKVRPELADDIARRRAELVLKPNDEYGGKGVVLGWTVAQDEWERALHAALRESYVVQQVVAVPREPYPIALGEGVQYVDLSYDTDPYLFDGRVLGVLTRLSAAALLNVTAGAGSVVPTYIVEGTA